MAECVGCVECLLGVLVVLLCAVKRQGDPGRDSRWSLGLFWLVCFCVCALAFLLSVLFVALFCVFPFLAFSFFSALVFRSVSFRFALCVLLLPLWWLCGLCCCCCGGGGCGCRRRRRRRRRCCCCLCSGCLCFSRRLFLVSLRLKLSGVRLCTAKSCSRARWIQRLCVSPLFFPYRSNHGLRHLQQHYGRPLFGRVLQPV